MPVTSVLLLFLKLEKVFFSFRMDSNDSDNFTKLK